MDPVRDNASIPGLSEPHFPRTRLNIVHRSPFRPLPANPRGWHRALCSARMSASGSNLWVQPPAPASSQGTVTCRFLGNGCNDRVVCDNRSSLRAVRPDRDARTSLGLMPIGTAYGLTMRSKVTARPSSSQIGFLGPLNDWRCAHVRYIGDLRDAYRLILLDPHGWPNDFGLLGRQWPLPHRASRLPCRLGLMEEALGLVRAGVVPHAPEREAKDIVGPFPERGGVTEAAARHRPARASKVAQRDRQSGPI